MAINYENIHQAIAALNQCVKENENKQTDTGAIRVSDLCADVSYFLCKVRQDYKQWQETKDGKMHVYVFNNSDDDNNQGGNQGGGTPGGGWKDKDHGFHGLNGFTERQTTTACRSSFYNIKQQKS